MAREPAAQEKIFALLIEWWPARALKQMLPNFKCCHLLAGDGKIMVYCGSKRNLKPNRRKRIPELIYKEARHAVCEVSAVLLSKETVLQERCFSVQLGELTPQQRRHEAKQTRRKTVETRTHCLCTASNYTIFTSHFSHCVSNTWKTL